jgi:hypothetical protein
MECGEQAQPILLGLAFHGCVSRQPYILGGIKYARSSMSDSAAHQDNDITVLPDRIYQKQAVLQRVPKENYPQ